MKQRNSFIVSLILIVTSVYFSSTAMAETVTAIQYNDEVSASEKAQKPIDVLLELISTENILVTLDPELVLHEERSAVLTAGTLLDRDVAVYKNKYQRLPSVLPLTRYMPKKVQATEEINATEVSAPVVEKVAAEKLSAAEARAAELNDKEVTIVSKAGDEGKLFGSIGVRDVADVVTAAGVEVAKSEVRLPEGAIRSVGEFDVAIQLHSEVTAIVKLIVVAE